MEYTKRTIEGREYTFQKCPQCSGAIGTDECHCHCRDNDDPGWLVLPIVILGIVGFILLFWSIDSEAQWYDSRKLKFTPTATLTDRNGTHVRPANIFEQGDVVHCVLVNLGTGKTVDKTTQVLTYRRIVEFPKQQDVQGWCMQGDMANVMEEK